jgi:tape measure domain-containing protein
MENAGGIFYTVDADTSALIKHSQAANDSLDTMQKSMDKTDRSAKQLGGGMTATAKGVKAANEEMRQGTKEASLFNNQMKVLLSTLAVGSLIRMAEGYQEMAERIRMATSSQEEFEMVQARLLRSAQETYRPLAEAQELYIRTSDALRSLGYSTDQALDIVDSLSLSFVKNATSQDRAQTALNAFTKAIQIGRLEGQGWQTVIAATPTIIDDIAAASGRTSAEVRALGAAGKLTAKDLNEGLRQSLEANRKAAGEMNVTVRDAFTNLNNSLSVYLGNLNNATGATSVISGALQLLGNNLDTVANILISVGAGALALYVTRLVAMTVATGQAIIAARAEAKAALDTALAHQAATAATLARINANRGMSVSSAQAAAAEQAHAAAIAKTTAAKGAARTATLGMAAVLGGPAGVVALLAAGASAFMLFRDGAVKAKPPVDLLTGSIDNLGDAQLRLMGIGISDKMEEVGRQARINAGLVETYNRRLLDHPNSTKAEQWKLALLQAEAALEGNNRELAEYEKRLGTVNSQMGRAQTGAPVQTSTAAGQEAVASMKQQLELAKQTGEARARLAALQKLGNDATAEEKAEVERLAAEIYRLEQARTANNKAMGDSKRRADEIAASQAANAKAVQSLDESLYQAGLSARDLAMRQAELSLNEYATPAQIARVRELAGVLADLKEVEENRALLAASDPFAGEQMRFETELQNLKKLNEDKLLEDYRYLELKTQAEVAHDEKMRALQEENFRRQSAMHDLLMNSVDALGAVTTDSLVGILNGTTTLQDAFSNLGQTILREVISSVVQMGIAQVKSIIMGQAAASAATAAGAAQASLLAAAWAAPAALASLATVGGNAVPAQAGIAATMATTKALATAGGRQYGGPVKAGGMYRINEDGAPEIYQSANGKQYMMPNSRGEVINNKDAQGDNKPQVNVNITVHGDGRAESRQQGNDVFVDVFLNDMDTDGPMSQSIQTRLGAQRTGL